ncbi:putative lipid II flippase FtsW [Humibacter sp. RRB41]|uniref:putative lipid II flippase FtsW n=1 Tax=Humibacter sp. RRB41 TaxID=2919946 RepID=UPI001FAA87AB|nr:putative lipid II flippase FtsW [Humibacter sp. RRB41]
MTASSQTAGGGASRRRTSVKNPRQRTGASAISVQPEAAAPSRRAFAARISLGSVFASESSNYFLLLGVTLFLVVFGFVMVLSASSVDGIGPDAVTQGIYAAIGIPIMLIVSRLPQSLWRRIAWPALIIAGFLQLLVVATPLGGGNSQNRNWLSIGGLQFQPSEAIKLAMIIWLGVFVSMKWDRVTQWRYMLLPIMIVTGAAIALVLAGQDLGTVMIMAVIVLGAMFIAGIPLRQLFAVIVIITAVGWLFVMTNQSRLERVTAFLHPQSTDPNSNGYQTLQGTWALASGGIFGVGLGNSRSKWNWLPEADSDFIFGVIGEELGLIGGIVVLALFVALAFIFIRIIRSSDDPFVRVTTAAVMVWLVGQALVNIGVVIGLLPPLGVPLPFISHGGTALLSSLFAVGLVLSFTRSPSPSKRQVALR